MSATNVYVPVYYIPPMFAFTQGDSELMAAARLLPYICFPAAPNMASGSLLPRVNYYWVLYLVGGSLMTIGSAAMIMVNPETPIAIIYGYSIILGAGTGLVFNLGFTVAGVAIMKIPNYEPAYWRPDLPGLSMKNLARALGGLGISEAEIRSTIMGTRSTVFSGLDPKLQREAIAAIANAMGRVYSLSIAAGVIAAIYWILMRKETLFPSEARKITIADGA